MFEDSDARIDILSLYTGEEGEYLQNDKALVKLKDEIIILLKSYGAIFALSFGGLIFSPLAPLGFATLLSAGKSFEYFRVITRLYDTMKMLLDSLILGGITITPRVRTSKVIIDLLVRMPDRRMFALLIRSSEGNSVIWREDSQRFYVAKKGKSVKKFDLLTRAMDDLQTIVDLKKEKHPLMGVTSSERSAPLVKAIVLAPGAKISIDSNRVAFGNAQVLKIKTTSTTYVVEYEDLVDFLSVPKKSLTIGDKTGIL